MESLSAIPCLLFRHDPPAELLLLPSFLGTVPEGRAFREVLSLPSDLCLLSDPRTQDPYFPSLPFALAILSDPGDDNEFRIVRNNIDTISYDDDGDRCLQVGHARPSILEIRVLLAVPVDPGALSHRRYRAHPFDPRGICRRNLADPFAPSAQEDLENRGDRPLRDNLAHQAHPESIRIVRLR